MPTVQRPRTFEQLVQTVAARVDLVPDYTEFVSAEDEQALIAAFIDDHVDDDSKAKIRSFDADWQRNYTTIHDALSPDLQTLWRAVAEHCSTMRWIHEEMTFAIGIEIGRRLAGGAR